MAGKRSRRARELDREPLDREASAKKPGLAAGSSRGRIAALQRSASFFVSLRGAVQPRTAVAKADPLAWSAVQKSQLAVAVPFRSAPVSAEGHKYFARDGFARRAAAAPRDVSRGRRAALHLQSAPPEPGDRFHDAASADGERPRAKKHVSPISTSRGARRGPRAGFRGDESWPLDIPRGRVVTASWIFRGDES